MRKEKAAVPPAKVRALEVFMRIPSSSPARSLSGSLGGSVDGLGRYLAAGQVISASTTTPINLCQVCKCMNVLEAKRLGFELDHSSRRLQPNSQVDVKELRMTLHMI